MELPSGCASVLYTQLADNLILGHVMFGQVKYHINVAYDYKQVSETNYCIYI